MPRVTVSKDSKTITPLDPPTLGIEEPGLADEVVPEAAAQADAPAEVDSAPPPPAPPVQQVVRQIRTVLIEVPLCDNPPGLDGTAAFCRAHVNLQLIRSRSATGRNLLHRLWWALKETGATLGNGRRVFNRNDALVWLIEQLNEPA